jgi:NADH-quinone oxidoreductase subunit N
VNAAAFVTPMPMVAVAAHDVVMLLPIIALTVSAIVVMLAGTFHTSHRLTVGLTLAGLFWTVAMIPIAQIRHDHQVTALLLLDDWALFFIGLLALTTAGVVLISYGYLARREDHPHDYYTLLLLATLGGAVLVASTHFASFFLGLEILSVSLYTLIAYPRLRADFIEAGVKYLVLAAATAAFLLFGMALVYAELGTMSLSALAAAHVTGGGAAETSLLVGGVALIIVGIGFKLGVVPFHMWTPDIYQGAPAPVTAFVATVSKGAMVALLLRYFRQVSLSPHDTVWLLFAVIAAASMIAGNLLALLQSNVKRLLAYSSIAHLGYILVAFLAVGRSAAVAVGFYLVAYFLTTLGAFGVVAELSGPENDADEIDDYRGLAARRPLLAATFALVLFSLAGIPLTVGFIGKFLVVATGANSRLWWLLVVLVASSTVGLYYYTRIVVAMYVQKPQDAPATSRLLRVGTVVGSRTGGSVLVVVVVLVLFLGIYPALLLRLLGHIVANLP